MRLTRIEGDAAAAAILLGETTHDLRLFDHLEGVVSALAAQ